MIELDYIPKVQKYDKNINIESYLNALDKLFEVEGKKESTNRLYKLFLNQFFQYCFDNKINPIEHGLDRFALF